MLLINNEIDCNNRNPHNVHYVNVLERNGWILGNGDNWCWYMFDYRFK
jgi:hypothetical protein